MLQNGRGRALLSELHHAINSGLFTCTSVVVTEPTFLGLLALKIVIRLKGGGAKPKAECLLHLSATRSSVPSTGGG